jgi:hypothetical protein
MEIKPSIRALEFFKQFPVLFRPARVFYRATRDVPKNQLRRLIRPTRTFGLSRGFYSGVEQVRSGQRPGRIVLEGQPTPRFGEDTLVRISGLEQDGNQPWPVFWLLEKNAYLSGPTLCPRDDAGRLMAEGTFSIAGSELDAAYWHFATKPKLVLSGNVTSVISEWVRPNYWHWLMDGIARLALLPEFPADTKILVPPLRSWMTWFLREMGLEGRWIETESRAAQVENFYFSTPSSMTGCYNPFAIHFLREKFLQKKSNTGTQPRRFYVIREGLTRGIHNEREVREFFVRRGWALVAPEKLSIPEQIELFAGAEAVVALHGSALANLIWCSPGCRVLEFAPDNFLAGAFEIVAHILNLPHDFIVFAGDSRTHIQVDLAVVEQKLEALGV